MGSFLGRERVGQVDRRGVANGIEEDGTRPRYREDHCELLEENKSTPATLSKRA